MAAAIPPWAQLVDESARFFLVTTSVDNPALAQRVATNNPAIPEPTTTTSANLAHPCDSVVHILAFTVTLPGDTRR